VHAIILAAGKGTRLGGDTPKPLVEIAPGRTLIGNQVDLYGQLVGRERIIVVLGHRAMDIIEAHPDLMYVFNERYASTNTGKSLLCAIRKLSGDDDVLWSNGDVYLEEGTLRRLIDSSPERSRILVNTARTAEEEVKYSVHGDGSIAELSKAVSRPLGEALGIQIIRAADRPDLERNLAAIDDHDYFEKALELATITRDLRLMPVDVRDEFCREVDFPEDLEEVRNYLLERVKP